MTSINSNRKFLIKSPNEILQDKIEELIKSNIEENENIKPNINFSNRIIKEKSKKHRYFIPKYYI